MPISVERANKHIADWSAALQTRGWWAQRLFFAAHVTTAAEILRSGKLVCRQRLGDAIQHDIANQEALGTNPIAHDYVRLYFRPRTVFHLRTEGIKLLSDRNRLAAHMSVPILFALDFAGVVTAPGAAFCERKMAHAGIMPGNNEAYFDSIDFTKVYHDSGISDAAARQDIHDRRMAEVLVPGELPLADVLKAVICRSPYDRITLNYLLGEHASDKLRTATKPAELFFCWGSYITELHFANDALTLKVKTSNDYTTNQALKFKILQFRTGARAMKWEHEYVLSRNPLMITGWDKNFNDHWRIEIEDSLAFEGPITAATTTVAARE